MEPSSDAILSLAASIRRRGLREPAIFALELCKPLVGCVRELYGMGKPLVTLLVGSAAAPAIEEVLTSSDSVERLIQLLESSHDAQLEGT
jgi:hypothetical protein